MDGWRRTFEDAMTLTPQMRYDKTRKKALSLRTEMKAFNCVEFFFASLQAKLLKSANHVRSWRNLARAVLMLPTESTTYFLWVRITPLSTDTGELDKPCWAKTWRGESMRR